MSATLHHTEGRCPERLKSGGCQLHNLHCGYPKCNEAPAERDAAASTHPVAQFSMVGQLGKRLAELLDEDQWAECEEMLLSIEHGPWRNLAVAVPVALNTVQADKAADLSELVASALDKCREIEGAIFSPRVEDLREFLKQIRDALPQPAAPKTALSYFADDVEAAMAQESGWRPISEAPKDGKPVILGCAPVEDEHDGFSGQGRWHEADDDGPDNMGHDAGFMDDNFDFFRCARSIGNPAYQHKGLQPTHFMPLPLPPAPNQGEAS